MPFRSAARRYQALLSLPGARVPVVASALGSLAIGMAVLAIILLAREATGSFAQAGRVVGAFGLANAVGAVAQGRLMDRLGQPRVLRAAAAGHLAALVALVVAAGEPAPTWVLALCAALAGICLPQVPAAMRSLWNALVEDAELRQTAYALVAIVFEVSVMTAPVLVAGVAAVASPSVAVLAAAGCAVGGALAFAATRASHEWRGAAHEVGWLGPLAATGMRAVFVVMGAFGVALGVLQVAVPAFAAEHGSAELGGVLLGALSAGSLTGGLIYGARSWPGAPAARLPVLLLVLAAALALLAVADGPLALAALLFAAGLLVAPVATVGSTLLDTVAPPGTATEAFAVMIMGIVAGNAVGNAIGGTLVDDVSFAAAVTSAGAIAAAGAGWVVVRRSRLRPAEPGSPMTRG
jgi:predicted MFS family arabinose efflux permease